MPVVWSDRCLLHEPAAEIWVGVPGPAAETPARAQAILDALDTRLVDAEPHPDKALLAVHDEALLACLASAWEEWHAAELPQEQVVPYVFAHRELGARRPATAVWARPGWFAYDTMTLVGSGTWEGARAAADAALTAGSGAGHRAACILAG
jgi:acetoin utilization deacetylase AcuC-like enzyme